MFKIKYKSSRKINKRLLKPPSEVGDCNNNPFNFFLLFTCQTHKSTFLLTSYQPAFRCTHIQFFFSFLIHAPSAPSDSWLHIYIYILAVHPSYPYYYVYISLPTISLSHIAMQACVYIHIYPHIYIYIYYYPLHA